MMEERGKFEQMTQEPVERLVAKLALPSITIMLISSLYNMADTFFVGRLGTSATAAVGIVFPLMAIIQAVGFFFGHGAGNYISRSLGARQTESAARMAATGFFSSLILGIVITASGTLLMAPLLRLLGATETILPHAEAYMGFILLGAPFMTSSLMLNNLLRFQGSAFYGMLGTISGAVLNIALDPLFIFGFGMGVRGAALATMLSQLLSFVLLLAGCMYKDNVRIRLKDFSPSPATYKEILRGGFPSLCRQGFASIAVICLNQAARGFGDAVIAAISIVNRVAMAAGSALLGFGQGFQPVCGFNYGAGLYDRVKRAFSFCVRISTGVLAALSVCGFIFAPDIISLFRRDDLTVITIGARALRFQCVTFPLSGWIVLNNMMSQTTGKAVEATILALARQGVFLMIALFILTPLFGLTGIQLSQPAADIATCILSIPLYYRIIRGMRLRKKKETEH